MEWIVDDISRSPFLFWTSNRFFINFIMRARARPDYSFSETFLTEYDPQTRKKRGVYYTPELYCLLHCPLFGLHLKRTFQ